MDNIIYIDETVTEKVFEGDLILDGHMTLQEQKEAARQFYYKWQNKGKEDEDDQSFWIDIFQKLFGVENATDKLNFQKKVLVNGSTKRIDAYVIDKNIPLLNLINPTQNQIPCLSMIP